MGWSLTQRYQIVAMTKDKTKQTLPSLFLIPDQRFGLVRMYVDNPQKVFLFLGSQQLAFILPTVSLANELRANYERY